MDDQGRGEREKGRIMKRWPKEKIKILEDNYLTMDNNMLAEKMGVKKHIIKSALQRYGLKRPEHIWRKMQVTARREKDPQTWTKAEEKYLRENMNEMTTTEIGKHLGRSRSSIRGKMSVMGLKRSMETRRKLSMGSYFPKGNVPYNKGMKGIHMSPETEFKPGHEPANTLFNGCITVRIDEGVSYKWIRIAEAKWEPYNRYVWREHNGEIPPKHIIGFKNGDTLDCRPENLYCMSQADNMKRNRNREKAAESMKRCWAEGRFTMSDAFIAAKLAPRNPQLREEVKKHPQLLELKRLQMKLGRQINEQKSE